MDKRTSRVELGSGGCPEMTQSQNLVIQMLEGNEGYREIIKDDLRDRR